MKTYEAIFSEDPEHGVYGISCVDRPAMQDEWITLAEQPKEIQFEAVDEEKQILLGAILIPNKKVYRNIDGHEFYLTFTDKTIEKLSHTYLTRGYQRNSSENHDKKLEDVSLVETWVVEDPIKDKSANFGKTYEKGTWVGMMKVDKETYQKAKEGKLTGFSIDALLPLKEINFSKMSETKSIIQTVLAEMGLTKKTKEVEKVTLGQLKLKDGKTKIQFEGDAPEIGKPVFLLNDEGERNRVPKGVLELEGGEKLNIDENGLVANEEVKAEPEKEEEVKEEKKEEKVEMSEDQIKVIVAALSKGVAEEFKAFKTEMADELAKRDAKIKSLEDDLASPAADEIVVKAQENPEPKTTEDRLMNAAISLLKQN